jgi:UDP-N-acetylmuramyl tripeptide synthase
MMLLSTAAAGLITAGIDYELDGDAEVSAIVHHTGKVVAGSLFCCIPGSRVDGHDLADQVVAAGAAALLVERRLPIDVPQLVVASVRMAMGPISARFWGDPSRAMTVIGVTGTNGKTTTAYLIEGALAAAGHRTGLIGTVETRVAGETRDDLSGSSARETVEMCTSAARATSRIVTGVRAGEPSAFTSRLRCTCSRRTRGARRGRPRARGRSASPRRTARRGRR